MIFLLKIKLFKEIVKGRVRKRKERNERKSLNVVNIYNKLIIYLRWDHFPWRIEKLVDLYNRQKMLQKVIEETERYEIKLI